MYLVELIETDMEVVSSFIGLGLGQGFISVFPSLQTFQWPGAIHNCLAAQHLAYQDRIVGLLQTSKLCP